MTKLVKILLGAAFLTITLVSARADDQKVDPTGTYIWTTPGRNGGPDRTNTLSLKLDGTTLTGKLSSPGRGGKAMETDINDGKLDGSKVSFSVVRSFQGNSFTNNFSGTVAAGAIKGTMEYNRGGDMQSRDWNATLQK